MRASVSVCVCVYSYAHLYTLTYQTEPTNERQTNERSVVLILQIDFNIFFFLFFIYFLCSFSLILFGLALLTLKKLLRINFSIIVVHKLIKMLIIYHFKC